MEHTSFHSKGNNLGTLRPNQSNHSQQIKTMNSSSNYLKSDQSSKSKDKMQTARQHNQIKFGNAQATMAVMLNTNPSVTSLSLAQSQRVNGNLIRKPNTKNPSQISNELNKVLHGQNKGQTAAVISSTGGHSFLRLNNNVASQNSNISNNLNSNASVVQDNSNSQISSLRKSPRAAAQMFNQELNRKPSYSTLKPNNLNNKMQIQRPASGRPRANHQNNSTQGNIIQQSFDKSQGKHLIQSVEHLTLNIQSNSQSINSSAARRNNHIFHEQQQLSQTMSSQRARMLHQISHQANSMQFNRTLRHYQQQMDAGGQHYMITEDDYFEKEQQLSVIHRELKNRSIEILTDQLMLKEKEIQSMKKQMDLMRDQLLQQQRYIETMNSQEKIASQEMIEERKSEGQSYNNQGLSFDDSELRVIEQKENHHLEMPQKSLTRSKGNHTSSQQTLPVKGMVKCGSSLMNNRLGKTKSTADLFGGFKAQLKTGENVQEYIMNQRQQEMPNLEDIIRESMIEASELEPTNNQANLTVDSRLQQDPNDKSLSLEKEKSEKMLDELFSNRETKFNASELDRLCNESDVFVQSNGKKEHGPIEYNNRIMGMNDDHESESEAQFIGGYENHHNNYSEYKEDQGKYICANQIIFDLDSYHESQPANDSRQVILRNEDSFTSKQTNEYLKDLMVKHQMASNDHRQRMRPSVLPYQNQILHTDSPIQKSGRSSQSNDTAKLSFSKENEQEFDEQALATQFSGSVQQNKRKKLGSPPQSNAILNAQSMQSISELLREVSPSNRGILLSAIPTTLQTSSGQIGEIKNMNLALKKKTIEFSSPNAHLPNKLLSQSKMDAHISQTTDIKHLQGTNGMGGMSRQKSSGKLATMGLGSNLTSAFENGATHANKKTAMIQQLNQGINRKQTLQRMPQ